MASKYSFAHDPLVNLAKMAALKGRDAAEEIFKKQNFELAIQQATAAKHFDPDLQGIDHFILAYQIHKAVAEKKDWYHVLGFQEVIAEYATLKKQYKELARFVHPDKNSSVAAEGAFKYVKAAWDFLSDPARKKAYDKSLSAPRKFKESTNNGNNTNSRKRARPPQANNTSSKDDRGYFKKTVNVIRTTSTGVKTALRISVCRVA